MTKGRLPKPKHLRQNRTKKAGATTLENPEQIFVPSLQNPDKRKFHRLTRAWWKRVWQSPMANEFLPTDVDGLARLALMVDNYYNNPVKETLSEIRLQEARFGLSPVDRSRLQWTVAKADAETKKHQSKKQSISSSDPREMLKVVK